MKWAILNLQAEFSDELTYARLAMRGATRERFDALVKSLWNLPAHLTILFQKYRQGNPDLTHWVTDNRSLGHSVVVVVMIERLGDIVACLPIAEYLKRDSNKVVIAWVCAKRFSGIFKSQRQVDRVFHEESLAAWLLTKRHLPPDLHCYELFLDSQRCTWTGIKLPNRHSGINHDNYLAEGSHLLLAYSRAAGIANIPNIQPQLFPSALNATWGNILAGKQVMAVHFDSEDPDRRLSEESANAFAAEAIRLGWTLVELGLHPIITLTSPNLLRPGSTLPLEQHISLLAASDHFAGTFSGFMVCANALNIPATIFIGTFRGFTKIQPVSGDFWTTRWNCLYGPWTAYECPKSITVLHVPPASKQEQNSGCSRVSYGRNLGLT